MIKKKIRLKNINIIQISIFIMIFCLMLFPFDQLSFLNGFTFANTDELIEYNIEDIQSVVDDTPEISNESLVKSLWQSNISPAIREEKSEQKDELQSLIEQLNSIEISMPSKMNENTQVVDNGISADQHKSVTENNITEDKDEIEKELNNVDLLISRQTLQKLREVVQNPEKIDNPYQIGDTLYQSSCIGEAALFYKEALKRELSDDIYSVDSRAWLLFQTGNCLMDTDMLEASDYYRQLVTEYPDYPWTDIARIQSNIISWYENEKPRELIEQYK